LGGVGGWIGGQTGQLSDPASAIAIAEGNEVVSGTVEGAVDGIVPAIAGLLVVGAVVGQTLRLADQTLVAVFPRLARPLDRVQLLAKVVRSESMVLVALQTGPDTGGGIDAGQTGGLAGLAGAGGGEAVALLADEAALGGVGDVDLPGFAGELGGVGEIGAQGVVEQILALVVGRDQVVEPMRVLVPRVLGEQPVRPHRRFDPAIVQSLYDAHPLYSVRGGAVGTLGVALPTEEIGPPSAEGAQGVAAPYTDYAVSDIFEAGIAVGEHAGGGFEVVGGAGLSGGGVVAGAVGQDGVAFAVVVLGEGDEESVVGSAAGALDSVETVQHAGEATHRTRQTLLRVGVVVLVELAGRSHGVAGFDVAGLLLSAAETFGLVVDFVGLNELGRALGDHSALEGAVLLELRFEPRGAESCIGPLLLTQDEL